MTDAPQVTPGAKALTEQAIILADDLRQLTIASNEDYQIAGEHLKRIKATTDALIAERKKATSPLDVAKKVIMDWFEPTLTALKVVDGLINDRQLAYRREQQRRIAEESEKQRVAQIAEAKRLEAMSRQAATIGRPDQADELRNRALDLRVAKPETTIELPKVEGQSVRKTTKYRILDVEQMPDEFVQRVPHTERLDFMAKTAKGQLPARKIPGVEFYVEETLATSHAG